VMVKGLAYAEAGLKAYEEQVLETKRRALSRLAKQLGRIVCRGASKTGQVM